MTDVLRLIDHPLVATLGWTLTHFVWQGAVLGLTAFFILRVGRPSQASVRYLVGVGTLAAMLIAPIATFISTAGHTASSQHEWRRDMSPFGVAGAGLVTGAIVTDVEGNPAVARTLMPTPRVASRQANAAPIAPLWLPIVTAIWMLGVGVLLLRMLGGWMLTQWLARCAVSAVAEDVEAAAREMARRLGLRRKFAVVESAAVVVPTLVGWLKPVVLLPASALSGLSPQQLHAVIAHELAHIRRHDYLINLLQTLVETLLFYHPAVWWVSSEVRAEREHCCDDLAVDVCGDRLVYVSALAELTSLERRAFALAATDGSLVTRVRRILGRPADTHRELPPSWGILVLLVLVGGGAGTYEMSADAADVAQIAYSAAAPARAAIKEAPTQHSSPLDQAPAVAARGANTGEQRPVDKPREVPSNVEERRTVAVAVSSREDKPSTQRGEGNFTWSNDDERLTVKWTGPFRLTDDERDIAWIEEGARVAIADGWVFTDRVELRGLAGGRIERTYYRSGFSKEFDAEGRAFLADSIQRMIRAGMFAGERVARLLKQGGPDAVMAEVDRLQTSSSYVKRAYYSALLQQADLTAAQLTQLLERVSTGINSDYDRRVVLLQALKEGLTDEQRITIVGAAAKMSSDYELRQVVMAALAAPSLPSALALAVLDSLGTVASAYERSMVLMELARRGAVTSQTTDRFLNVVTTMPSSYEQRKVLAALAAMPAIAQGVGRESLKAVAAIASSHDKAEVLIQTVKTGVIDDDTAAAFFSAVDTIASSHDKYRVLSALAANGRLSDTVLGALLRSVKRIGSNHERSKVLLEVLKTQTVSANNRTLFLEAADTISATHEQNQVLAALVRAERR